ncbi:MAG: lipoyl(octanoyl) transferase LipB [Puniceicoccaceae bacterium]
MHEPAPAHNAVEEQSGTNPPRSVIPKIAYYQIVQQDQSHMIGNTVDWGRTSYKEAYDRQLLCVAERIAGERGDTLIFTEHSPVYTIGRRKNAEQHLKWGAALLEQAGIAVEMTNRGGDVTYHGPGQLVAYPIVNLAHHKDLHRYLRHLEEALIRTLAHFGLFASRRQGMTGIWLEKRKIAAMGIAVKQWVTYHGLALNVDPDLEHFAGIVPCGITDGTVTSMAAELGYIPDMAMVKHLLEVEFWGIFTNYANPC